MATTIDNETTGMDRDSLRAVAVLTTVAATAALMNMSASQQIQRNKMTLIISLIIYLVVLGLIWSLIGMLPLPAPVAKIVQFLFIVLLIIIILAVVGILPGISVPLVRM
jgi:antibiotic biosynthesis monooxygenase (ABM) superfamily enzyme